MPLRSAHRRMLRAFHRMPPAWEAARRQVLALRGEVDAAYAQLAAEDAALDRAEEVLEAAAEEWFTERGFERPVTPESTTWFAPPDSADLTAGMPVLLLTEESENTEDDRDPYEEVAVPVVQTKTARRRVPGKKATASRSRTTKPAQ